MFEIEIADRGKPEVQNPGRRAFLGVAGAAVVLGLAQLFGTYNSVEATRVLDDPVYVKRYVKFLEDNASVYNDFPWSHPNWLPIYPQTAARRGLRRLIDGDEPILYLYDQLSIDRLSRDSSAYDFEWRYTEDMMRRYPSDVFPGFASSMGKCHGLAITGLLDPEPPFGGGNVGGRNIDQATLVAWQIVRQQGREAIPMNNADTGQPNYDVIAAVLSKNIPIMVNYPLDEGGLWFRAAWGYNPRKETAWFTNFGNEPIELSINGIRGAWFVIGDHTEVADNIVIEGYTRKNPGMNPHLIDALMRNGYSI